MDGTGFLPVSRQKMVVSLEDEEIDAANAAALSGKLLQMANGAICNEEKSVLHGRSDVRRLGYILLPIKFAEAVRSSADG